MLKKRINSVIICLSAVWGSTLFTQTCSAQAKQPTQAPVTYLNQAWSDQDRAAYYWTSQGSALLSYDIYLALQVAGSDGLFNSPKNSDRLGLLTEPTNPKINPDGLPIGIAKAVVSSGQFKGVYAGMTCAACHTGQIQYKGQQVRIDGGVPNRLNAIAWIQSLNASVQETLENPERFQAMLERIRSRGPVDESDLRMRLETDAVFVSKVANLELAIPFHPGPGRMDALSGINNLFMSIDTDIIENLRLSTAPVKAPFLWNASQSAWVQWSGVAENPIARNHSEALGVFVRTDLSSARAIAGTFESTHDVRGLIKLEELLRRLAPPAWPEQILGKLDQGKVEIGAKLFAKHCLECHTAYPYRWGAERLQGKRMIENALVPLSVIGTDPAQLNSPSFDSKATFKTGQLSPLFNGKTLVTASEYFAQIHDKMIIQNIELAKPFSAQEQILMNGYLSQTYTPMVNKGPVNSYKAAPREGAWSSAPFLHNGSVPNLYELLSPESERSKRFYVNREFDPVKLGIDTSLQARGFLFDTQLPGNSNAGHAFQSGNGKGIIGPELSVAERYALIEYMKSIPKLPGQVTPFGGPANPVIAAEDPLWFNTKHPY